MTESEKNPSDITNRQNEDVPASGEHNWLLIIIVPVESQRLAIIPQVSMRNTVSDQRRAPGSPSPFTEHSIIPTKWGEMLVNGLVTHIVYLLAYFRHLHLKKGNVPWYVLRFLKAKNIDYYYLFFAFPGYKTHSVSAYKILHSFKDFTHPSCYFYFCFKMKMA